MSKPNTNNGGGGSKEIEPSARQDALRRASKAGRNHKTKGTMVIDARMGTRLDGPGAIAARRKAAYDKAKKIEWREQRSAAIMRDRKNEYLRKGTALLTLRDEMDVLNDDVERLEASVKGASGARVVDIKRTISKIDGRLRGMQRKAESLEARVKEPTTPTYDTSLDPISPDFNPKSWEPGPGACRNPDPEPHLAGEFPMSCYPCHMVADS